jgi:putative salt-induced outer membrane protein
MRMKSALLMTALLSATALADPAPRPDAVPKPVADMIRIAVDSGDPALAAKMVQLAKTSNPAAVVAIDALYKKLLDTAEKRRLAALMKQRYYQGWKGKGEFGAFDTNGDVSSTGVTAKLSLLRDGLRWKQEFTASVDYLRTSGVEQTDRYFAGHQANYKFSDRVYALGLVNWEGNRVQGFNSRETASVGAGVAVIKQPHMGLSVEVSPALRSTNYVGAESDTSLAARVAGNYHWDVTPRVSFSEDATYYRESDDHTLTSESAMTVKLIGALSTRFSYRLQKESKTLPLPALHSDNGTSRMSLVYTF